MVLKEQSFEQSSRTNTMPDSMQIAQQDYLARLKQEQEQKTYIQPNYGMQGVPNKTLTNRDLKLFEMGLSPTGKRQQTVKMIQKKNITGGPHGPVKPIRTQHTMQTEENLAPFNTQGSQVFNVGTPNMANSK